MGQNFLQDACSRSVANRNFCSQWVVRTLATNKKQALYYSLLFVKNTQGVDRARWALLFRREQHHHAATLSLGPLLYFCHLFEIFGHPFEQDIS